jgi:hypothetical protein
MRPHCLVLTLFASFITVMPAEAARLLKFTILVDGKVAYSGLHEDDGRAGKAQVWSYWESVKLLRESDAPPTAPDETLRSRLRGQVMLRVEHGQQVLAEASLADLLLLRDDPQSVNWKVAPEEIDRTAKLAGVRPLPDQMRERSKLDSLWLILGALVIAAIAFTFIQYRGGRGAMATTS